MLFYYRKGKNASQVTNSICSVYGEGALAERTVRKWFAKFRAGDFNLKDQERSGRPSTTDDDQIETLIENNPRYTTRELAEILKISKTTVHELGYAHTARPRTRRTADSPERILDRRTSRTPRHQPRPRTSYSGRNCIVDLDPAARIVALDLGLPCILLEHCILLVAQPAPRFEAPSSRRCPVFGCHPYPVR
ncbi:Histone-lysine N-methyltransferase SETMAR [Ooceraea biroi]|uniref:Histone-lysine N-methyltransferase SETMAR n=1 Tax=Ooceraea biroi TaxID=2015173 RepID=A0A026WZT4_OOCBI|nr:Histone-lysine N-methyltransferase SETMAR [Ooceraea biroi]